MFAIMEKIFDIESHVDGGNTLLRGAWKGGGGFPLLESFLVSPTWPSVESSMKS